MQQPGLSGLPFGSSTGALGLYSAPGRVGWDGSGEVLSGKAGNPFLTSQPAGSWIQGVGVPQAGQGGRTPVGQRLQQQRTAVPLVESSTIYAGSQAKKQTLSAVIGGAWKNTHTGSAIKDLHVKLESFFLLHGPAVNAGENVAVPVTNLRSSSEDASHLASAILSLCASSGDHGGDFPGIRDIGPGIRDIGRSSYNTTVPLLPVSDLIDRTRTYVAQANRQLWSLLELLRALFAPIIDRERLLAALQTYRREAQSTKDTYQICNQVTNALSGAMLRNLKTCPFFTSKGRRNPGKLWSLVLARTSSAAKYIALAVDTLSRASPTLVELLNGGIAPHSIEDYSRSKAFFKTLEYLNRAEARSVSAVSYFNDLKAAFQEYSGEDKDPAASLEAIDHLHGKDAIGEQDFEENHEMSLMDYDLGNGDDEAVDDGHLPFDYAEGMQTVEAEDSEHVSEGEDQTVEFSGPAQQPLGEPSVDSNSDGDH